MAKVFDGKAYAAAEEMRLMTAASSFKAKKKRKPAISVFLLGEDKASEMYVRLKGEAAERIGVSFNLCRIADNCKAEKLVAEIEKRNNNRYMDGIMIQLPLPAAWTEKEKQLVIGSINPDKDIDCLTPENLGKLQWGGAKYLPATVRAIWMILNCAGIDNQSIIGKKISILGKSNIVGKPLANMLINKRATVTICHSMTSDLAEATRNADILIAATGQQKMVKPGMVKNGAIVIDAGEPKGDVDFESVFEKASFITPVPGGVGPVTILCLFKNLLEAAGKNK